MPKKVTKSASKRKSDAKVHKSAARQPDPLTDLIDASSKAFELVIDPAWRPAVHANLRVIFGQAGLFMAFELPDDAEPAPIFKA
jgi:hypothetical protein